MTSGSHPSATARERRKRGRAGWAGSGRTGPGLAYVAREERGETGWAEQRESGRKVSRAGPEEKRRESWAQPLVKEELFSFSRDFANMVFKFI